MIEQQEFHDIITHTPEAIKTISAGEYSIFDPNVLFFFHLMSHGDKTAIKLRDRWLNHLQGKKKKSIPAKKKESLLKVTKTNLKELTEVNVIDSDVDGEIEFNSVFLDIIEIIDQNPSTFEEIKLELDSKQKHNSITAEGLHNFIKILEDAEYIRKTIKILHDKNHLRIIEIMRTKPHTVKELEVAYNDGLSKKDSKSENTIYRYLHTLKSAGLILQAGQRVNIGRTATETLYNISAKIFFTPSMTADEWKNKMGRNIIEVMQILLESIPDNLNANNDCLRQILIEITASIEKEKDLLIANSLPETMEKLGKYSTQEINSGFRNAGLLMLFLKDPEKVIHITDCLKEKSN